MIYSQLSKGAAVFPVVPFLFDRLTRVVEQGARATSMKCELQVFRSSRGQRRYLE